MRSCWLPLPLLRPSAPTPALRPSHSARHCYPVQSCAINDQKCRTGCFQQNAPAQTSSWESWSAWVVNNHMSCWGAHRWLSTITHSVMGHCRGRWERWFIHSVLQRTEVPVQIGRWGFTYSFQSKLTSTMCHDEKDRKLNQNHNLLIKWVSGPNPDGNHQEIKNWGGKIYI